MISPGDFARADLSGAGAGPMMLSIYFVLFPYKFLTIYSVSPEILVAKYEIHSVPRMNKYIKLNDMKILILPIFIIVCI